MSEPFIERLSRFTPAAGALDRDALLYAAGRESARPNRAWIALAAALTLTQPLYLMVLWWPRGISSATHVPAAAVSLPSPPETHESPASDLSENTGLWAALHNLTEADAQRSPAPQRAVTFVESGPPLRAFGPPPPSILN